MGLLDDQTMETLGYSIRNQENIIIGFIDTGLFVYQLNEFENNLLEDSSKRVIYEFRCAAYSIECPPVSREKVANILLAHAGRGGARGITEAAAKIARFAARSWLAPLFDTVCDRLGFVLGNLFDLALERNRNGSKTANMDDCVGFHAALRCAYSRFIKDLSKQCKQLIRHHLDSVTSPFLQLDVLLVFLDV
ncbi:hypothetical protein Ahy_B10g105117 isoform H [Arachis hypogaea]|nr:hypothetical protein Ahy_B10g105117 isoform H [Arachis hypogaea]